MYPFLDTQRNVTFVSSSQAITATDAGGVTIVDAPTSISTGNLLLLFIGTEQPTVPSYSWPSGFTEGSTWPQSPPGWEGVSNFRMGGTFSWAWKIATGSEPATYSITESGGGSLACVVLALNFNVNNLLTPILSSNIQCSGLLSGSIKASPADFTGGSVIQSLGECTLIITKVIPDSGMSGSTWNTPAGYTKIADPISNGFFVGMSAIYKIGTSTTAEGIVTQTVTQSARSYDGSTYTLRIGIQ